jgi:hypothetical protein
MKAILNIDSIVRCTLEPVEKGMNLSVAVMGPGKQPSWKGPLTVEEAMQLEFAITRVTKGELTVGDGENLLAERAVFLETIQRQVGTIDEIKKVSEKHAAESLEKSEEIVRLNEALENQKGVIDTLRAQLGEAVSNVHKEPSDITTEPENAIPSESPPAE